ncbi:MAG TPA: FHA domain-containing protein [Hyphomicrobium sp.]|nr:FHA domain-containing protein [Hyphomicrobium sp.]
MIDERGEKIAAEEAKAANKAGGFLGSLKDALMAAGRDEMPSSPARMAAQAIPITPIPPAVPRGTPEPDAAAQPAQSPSAEEVARLARSAPVARPPERIVAPVVERDAIPTTRVVRAEVPKPKSEPTPERTQLVRGRKQIERGTFEQDPVVGFLVVVGGPGLGSFRPIFEGNNTVGRTANNRVPLDFGDDAISSEAQAYIRYDSNDRSFLFVPNLAKTNVVSVNEKKPTGAVELKPMDVITLGRTQVAFVPFCGSEFDWSEIAEA